MHFNQNSVAFFIEIDELILKFIWKCTGTKVAKTILERKKKAQREITLSNFEITIKQQ